MHSHRPAVAVDVGKSSIRLSFTAVDDFQKRTDQVAATVVVSAIGVAVWSLRFA